MGLNVFGLKRPITRTEITIEQLRNLFGGTRLFNLVQPLEAGVLRGGGWNWVLGAFRVTRRERGFVETCSSSMPVRNF